MRTRNAVLALPTVIAVGVLAGCSTPAGTDDAGPAAHASTSPTAPPATSPAANHSSHTPSPSGGPTPASAGPSSTPAGSTAPTPAAPPACATDLLRLSQGNVEGAAGSTYVTYYLRNVGPRTCVLDGHPGFALLRADGSVIQHPADRGGAAPRPVRVAPGKRAKFVVRTSEPGTSPGCSYHWKTAQVQVYPPDQTKAIRQPSDIQACNLVVDPVTAP